MGGRLRIALLAVSAAGLLAVPAARADSLLVPNLNWTGLLPALNSPTQPQPGPVPNCKRPSIACVDFEIRRLSVLRDRLGCDHRAVFATTYLELTKALRKALKDSPGLIADKSYFYTEDAQFANIYFDTFAAYDKGRRVAPAWRVAFDAATRPGITATQDMLLGINAHVQNDMPFLLAGLGLRTPDGASRKPDHDAENEVLNRAYAAVVEAVRSRYDPILGVSNPALLPTDDIAGLEMVRGWREGVWRNAERLLNAHDKAQRRNVTRQIHANAAAWAAVIATPPVPGWTPVRDSYCATHHGG
ncbi:MAG: DUF5995 family protein [Solirubrobacterales bacterium]